MLGGNLGSLLYGDVSVMLITEPQNLNQSCKGYHTEVWMGLDVS